MLSTVTRTVIVVVVFVGLIFAVAIAILNGCAPAAYVKTAPPPPKHEVISPKPHPNAVWLAGRWDWRGDQYVWIDGRWDVSPRGDAWVPGRWKKTHKGWVWAPGRWSK
jgi:hypothetical protein